MSLHLDWCSHNAAVRAVKRWHYSESMPTPPTVRIGVWEDGRFIGAVIFSRGASSQLGKQYGLKSTEVAELARVALAEHKAPVSRILSIAIKMLRQHSQGLRLLVSFADTNHGHHGGIYQASNWIYAGETPRSHKYIDKSGRVWHGRQVSTSGYNSQYGTRRRVPRISECTKVVEEPKHRYLLPLDKEMADRVSGLAQAYPKRAVSIGSDATTHHVVEGGATPTTALQIT